MSRTVAAPNGMVCSIDVLASNAGVSVLQLGGTAIDAAIATSAAERGSGRPPSRGLGCDRLLARAFAARPGSSSRSPCQRQPDASPLSVERRSRVGSLRAAS